MAFRINLKSKFIFYFVVIGFISSAISTAFAFHFVNKLQMEVLRSRLLSIVKIASQEIDSEAFQRISGAEDEDGPIYNSIKAALKRCQNYDRDVKYIYTLRKTDKKDILEFVVDTQNTLDINGNGMIDPDEEKAHVGEAYNAGLIAPKMLEGFNGPIAEDKVAAEKWGDLLSAYAPIRDPSGAAVGIVGADFDVSILDRMSANIVKAMAYAFVIASFFWLIFAVLLGNTIVKPIGILKSGLQAIAAGNSNVKVNISSQDEFGLLGSALNDMSVALKERELYLNVLKRYVSPTVAEEIIKSDKSCFLIPCRRRVTILFADLWNFTPLAEKMRPEDVVAILNTYFKRMVEVIYAHHGTLDKFLGDGLMAMFGAPLDIADQEMEAVSAALEMKEGIDQIQNELQQFATSMRRDGQFSPVFKVGIGINTGLVVVGSVGSEKRTEYTAIGDEVNLASRLQTATRHLDQDILISSSTMTAVKHDFVFEAFENVQLKGISRPITAYSVKGRSRG